MSEGAALRCGSFLLVVFMVNGVNLGSRASRGKKTTSPQPYVLFSSSLCPSWVRSFAHLVQESLNCPRSGHRGREIIFIQPRFFFWIHGFLSPTLPQATFLGKMRLAEFFFFLHGLDDHVGFDRLPPLLPPIMIVMVWTSWGLHFAV